MVVFAASGESTGIFSTDADVTLSLAPAAEALEEAGVPFTFDPYDPRSAVRSWYSLLVPRPFRIVVARADEDRARAAIEGALEGCAGGTGAANDRIPS